MNFNGLLMRRQTTTSFVLEIPLQVDAAQERSLLARLEIARQVYNACLGESLRRLNLKRDSQAYHAALKLPKGAKRQAAFA
jgi:putative transposase